jgi:hypothetical protein
LNYIARHWRGELDLAVAFWINFVALNLVLLALRPLIEHGLLALALDDDPRRMAQLGVLHVVFVYGLITPWQVVGLWRSAGRRLAGHGRRIWPLASRGAVGLSLAITLVTLILGAPIYRDILLIGFGPDRYGNYTITRVGDGSLLRFEGYIGYRAARDLRRILRQEPEVRGIILDSRGGWIAAGRALSGVIGTHALITYSFEGCHSACTTAFIAGDRRFLADEARLGFHQYAVPFPGLEAYSDMHREQQRDLHLFRRQGVQPAFLARLFQAGHEEAWYPSQRELLGARVITGVVRSEEVLFGLDVGADPPEHPRP